MSLPGRQILLPTRIFIGCGKWCFYEHKTEESDVAFSKTKWIWNNLGFCSEILTIIVIINQAIRKSENSLDSRKFCIKFLVGVVIFLICQHLNCNDEEKTAETAGTKKRIVFNGMYELHKDHLNNRKRIL